MADTSLATPSTSPPSEPHPLLKRLQDLSTNERRRRFTSGLTLPLHSTRFLLQNPTLWPWAILPALINVVLFLLVTTFLILNAGTLLDVLWSRPEITTLLSRVLLALWYFAYVGVLLLAILMSYFAVLLAAGVIASPFNDILSQKTEAALTGSLLQRDEGHISGLLRSIGSSLVILLAYLATILPLLLLHLIPGAGSVAYTICASLVGSFFLAVEYSDAALDRCGLGLLQKLRRIREALPLSGGFGLGTSLILFIPFINFLAMPIAVVGGTALGITLRDQ